jgi:hypothetical protein
MVADKEGLHEEANFFIPKVQGDPQQKKQPRRLLAVC